MKVRSNRVNKGKVARRGRLTQERALRRKLAHMSPNLPPPTGTNRDPRFVSHRTRANHDTGLMERVWSR